MLLLDIQGVLVSQEDRYDSKCYPKPFDDLEIKSPS